MSDMADYIPAVDPVHYDYRLLGCKVIITDQDESDDFLL